MITSCTEIIHCNKVSRQLVQQSVVSAKAHKKALLVSEVGTAMPRRVAYAYHFHLSSEVCLDVKNPLSFGVQAVNYTIDNDYTSIFMLDPPHSTTVSPDSFPVQGVTGHAPYGKKSGHHSNPTTAPP